MKNLLRFLALTLLATSPGSLFGEEEDRFSEAEIDQMLAPIALYPDALLAQILTASTYPLEVVEAHRWAQSRGLEGEEAVEAADSQEWDPSVKALVAFPNVLERMNDDLAWTRNLGEAVLLQEEEVMASVQKLRAKAHAAGSLAALENVEVRREKEIIYIEPANPRIVYIPYYQPTVVYGSWWWPAYPPVYWRPFTSVVVRTGSARIIWTHGYHFPSRYYYSHPDWHRRHIVIHHHYHKRPQQVHRSNHHERWQHRSEHRRGVRYRSLALREHYASRHHPERQRSAHAQKSAQRRERGSDAENRRERRPDRSSSATRPERRDSARTERGARERQEHLRARRDTVSPERREETVRRNPDSRSEYLRQRLARDRAQQQQRTERPDVQGRQRPTTGTDWMRSPSAQNQRSRAPQVDRNSRTERRRDGQSTEVRQRSSEQRRPQATERRQRPPRQEMMRQPRQTERPSPEANQERSRSQRSMRSDSSGELRNRTSLFRSSTRSDSQRR